ncbi:hypothetical protein HER10_EVM0001403 [Colletotrichum scovillei]|uniref:Uncharacterized protein n=1 Tax=Colletotrichum scovillei TaxID=1209932 RepID=A0A9P7RGB1_9PEZI|nr:uncharacterized protein HER10_EVM0001403 [Colletotrichum scovillei]KAF4784984.1 hypothetical protein HER10_EVM0001403 [Colletotrichum scovillei]KAG7055634.1 hypothetical protein JMJ77_0008087 [Colletotrichum scovillei]KAG7075049.1 hypothetical protein JMJ76_0011512 [Colletotrichum scovillei]KAG7082170.1 hypothetical protein JMJ78_0004274 [Colletotrichum scovillei]
MSSRNIPKRNATGAFATPIDPPQLRAHPRAHQEQDGNENLIDETAKMAKKLTESPSQTQCVFGNEDIAPGTSIAGVSGRLGDPKLASMRKMVLDSVPEGSQVKIIYIVTKEDGNNDLRAGIADNAAAARAGSSEVGRFVQRNNAVQDRIRARVHQHRLGENHDEEDEDVSPRPRKRRRASCRVSPLHMSPGGLKIKQEDEDEEEEQIKEEADDEIQEEVDDEVKEEVDDEVKEEVDDEFKEEIYNEFNEEVDDEALFYPAPNEVTNRSISSSHDMHRATFSLDSPHFDTSFLSSVRTAHQTNTSDSNNNGDEEDDEELVQVRYTGDYFENFYNAYAAAFPSEGLPPYRRWDDLPLPRLR